MKNNIFDYVISAAVILLVAALYVDIKMDCEELKLKQQYIESLVFPNLPTPPHLKR